jgi:hypothetical protein
MESRAQGEALYRDKTPATTTVTGGLLFQTVHKVADIQIQNTAKVHSQAEVDVSIASLDVPIVGATYTNLICNVCLIETLLFASLTDKCAKLCRDGLFIDSLHNNTSLAISNNYDTTLIVQKAQKLFFAKIVLQFSQMVIIFEVHSTVGSMKGEYLFAFCLSELGF